MAQFPLDGKFALLREEVQRVIDQFVDLRTDLKEMSRDVLDAGAAAERLARATPQQASRPAGGGGGGGASSSRTERNTTELVNIERLKEAHRLSREFASNFGEFRESVSRVGDLSAKFGFKRAGRDIKLFADRLEIAEKAVRGTVSGARLLGAAFAPAVVAVVTAGGALLAFQKLLQNTLGITATLSETVQLFGLGLERGFRKAQEAYLKLQYAISGDDNALITGLQQTQDAIDTIDRDVSALIAKIEARPQEESKGFLKDSFQLLGQFGDEVFKTLNEVLGYFEQTTTAANELNEKLEEGPSALDNFREGLARLGDLTSNTFDFILSGVQQISATISSTLLSAFLDPHADIKQAFSTLFRSLAQQLLQLIIQTLIVRAISGLGFSQGGQVPAQALAKGGRVRGGGGRRTPAHAFAQGLAEGGLPFGRPSWVPASDTVPAWLTPGEFVEPVSAVKQYGADFMEGLRTLSLDAVALRAVAGLPTGRRHASVRSGAFAAGGGVSSSAPNLGGGAPPVAIMVPDEQTASRLFAQAPKAFLAAARRHRSELKAILGR